MKIHKDTPDSSSISSYTYDTDTLELDVTFKSKVSYRYFNVNKETFDKLHEAPSVGNFIATKIKKFDYEEVKAVENNPWKFPKAEDYVDLSSPSRWPFPTGPKPGEPTSGESSNIDWTPEEEEEFKKIVFDKGPEF